MAADEHCPNCRLPLPAPGGGTTPATHCPRCDYPLPAAGTPAREGIQQRLSSWPPANRITAEVPASIPRKRFVCPGCRRPVEEEWLFCPHCEAVLLDPSCNRIILPRTLVPLLAAVGALLVSIGLYGGLLVSALSRNWVLAAVAACPVYFLPLLARPRFSQRFGLPRDVAEPITAVGICMAIFQTIFVPFWLVLFNS
jgi:hypothetical protein